MKTAKKPLRDKKNCDGLIEENSRLMADAVLYPCEIFDLIQPNSINEALRHTKHSILLIFHLKISHYRL